MVNLFESAHLIHFCCIKLDYYSFDVVISAAGDKKIQVIKVVRAITGLGLKEAKDLVDGAPGTVKEGVGQAEADDIKKQIEEVGGVIELK